AGPLSAGTAAFVGSATDTFDLGPFPFWTTTVLVTAVCVPMAAGCGRCWWGHLVSVPHRPPAHRAQHHFLLRRVTKAPIVSLHRHEQALSLLYPVGQAAPRRPYRLGRDR